MGRKFSRDNPSDSTAMQAYDENHFKIAREKYTSFRNFGNGYPKSSETRNC